jgi:ankyrin repeat domain-containing protein 50
MDGLSAAACVIAVIQISGQVFDLCRMYYSEVKDARTDIQRLCDEVTSLQNVLTNVAHLTSAKLPTLDLLNQPDGPVQHCLTDLIALAAKLNSGQGKDKMRHFGLRALKWPFGSKDVDKVITTIGRHKTTFTLALTTDQTYVELYSCPACIEEPPYNPIKHIRHLVLTLKAGP